MAGTIDQELVGLVESAAMGDDVAFARIVAAYHEQMFGLCVVICRDRSLAEEAVQSAWTLIWRRLDPDDRALVAMRYVFGFDATELSATTGISPAGTRQRLKRLLDRLRQELE
mgnify:CR=1 FL=1